MRTDIDKLTGSINGRDYGMRGDGVTENTPCLQSAIDSLGAAGGNIFIPRSESFYLFDLDTPVSIPSRISLISNGAELRQGGVTDDNNVVRHLMVLHDDAQHVSFNGLRFTGVHETGPTSNWSTIIRCVSIGFSDVRIERCAFENLVGYSISLMDGSDVKIADNHFVNCGGGINPNAKRTRFVDNYLDHSGGIEASGGSLQIARNQFHDVHSSSVISAGGFIATNHYESGMQIADNLIDGFAGAIALAIAESVENVLVTGNVIQHMIKPFPDGYALAVISSNVDYKQRKILISNNIFANILSGALEVINAGQLVDVQITNNQIGPDVMYGCYIQCPGVTIANNRIHTTQYTLDLQDCPDAYLSGNDLVSGVGAGQELRLLGTTTLRSRNFLLAGSV